MTIEEYLAAWLFWHPDARSPSRLPCPICGKCYPEAVMILFSGLERIECGAREYLGPYKIHFAGEWKNDRRCAVKSWNKKVRNFRAKQNKE